MSADTTPAPPISPPLVAVRWNELFPWLILFRAARVALMARVIALAVVGVLATQVGWSAIESVFWNAKQSPPLVRITQRPAPTPLQGLGAPGEGAAQEIREEPQAETGTGVESAATGESTPSWREMTAALTRPDVFESVDGQTCSGPLARGWAWIVQPLSRLYGAKSWGEWFALHLAGGWTIAVWALFGGAISRIAAIYLTRGEAISLVQATTEAVKKWPSTAGAPTCCYLALAVLAVPLLAAGAMIRLAAR